MHFFLAQVGAVQPGSICLACQRAQHSFAVLCQLSGQLLINIADLLDDQLLAWLQSNQQLLVTQAGLA